jgi:hypothetical protein
MAAINYFSYINNISIYETISYLKQYPKLNIYQIDNIREPERKLLYAYYGYIAPLDNYNDLELNTPIIRYTNNKVNVYLIAIMTKNLKMIKYLDSRNININNIKLYDHSNIYLYAIYNGYIKIVEYFILQAKIWGNDFEGYDYIKNSSAALKSAGRSGFLKMIKYFELQVKDSPNFNLKIINCYISAASAYKPKIRILKYLESKYPLFITNDIINEALNKAIRKERFNKIKYLNKIAINKLNNWAQNFLLYSCCIGYYQYAPISNNIYCKMIKYLFSKCGDLYISRPNYNRLNRNEEKKPTQIKIINNYLIKYKAKYRLCYI